MTGLRLKTKMLELVPKTAEEMQASLEAMDQNQKAQLSADWLARFRAATSTDPWVHGFSAIVQQSGEAVGTGGFKGPPADGTVEIAYGSSPISTARVMARRLRRPSSRTP